MRKVAVLVCVIALSTFLITTAETGAQEELNSDDGRRRTFSARYGRNRQDRRNEGRIIATTEAIKTSQEEEIKPIISVESSSPQATDVRHNGDCSCTLNYEDPAVIARTGSKILKQGDTIKLHETVSLGCESNSNIFVWRNGFRLFGNVSMTCSTCKKWEREDLPTCSRAAGDTFISIRENLKILPGGIVEVPMGETRIFPCISSYGRPQWLLRGRGNVTSNEHHFIRNGTTFYTSYLEIARAKVGHTGTYHCYLRDTHGAPVTDTFLRLQVKDAEDRSTSTPRPRVTSPSRETQPSVNVESASEETSREEDVKHINNCCIYENKDHVVNAQIGNKILKFGDRIRQGEKISFECRTVGMALTWKNGLRLYGKVNMICNTCKKWQERDVPVCKMYERSNTFISFDEELNILPGGIVSVQEHRKRLFVCSSAWKQPEWDYEQREKVLETKTKVLGPECTHFISFLDVPELENDHSGRYECFIRDDMDQRIGSTFLYLKVDETVCKIPQAPEFGHMNFLGFEGKPRAGSIAVFSCEDGKVADGPTTSKCLDSGIWTFPPPKCLRPCTVPYVSNGEIGKFVQEGRYRRKVYRKMYIGAKIEDQEELVLRCSAGFEVPDPGYKEMAVYCGVGKWSVEPICKPESVSCPDFPNSPGLQVTYSNEVSVGSIATFRCSISTRHLIGSTFSVCQGNRSWSNPLPSCEDPKCSINDLSMSVPEDVEPDILDDTQEYVTFGTELRLKCFGKNYVMTGDSKAQCGEQGKWKLEKFECVVGCLLNLDPSSHLIVQPVKDSYRVGEFVLLSCPPGEEMSSKVERLMCMPGRWSDTLPECKE